MQAQERFLKPVAVRGRTRSLKERTQLRQAHHAQSLYHNANINAKQGTVTEEGTLLAPHHTQQHDAKAAANQGTVTEQGMLTAPQQTQQLKANTAAANETSATAEGMTTAAKQAHSLSGHVALGRSAYDFEDSPAPEGLADGAVLLPDSPAEGSNAVQDADANTPDPDVAVADQDAGRSGSSGRKRRIPPRSVLPSKQGSLCVPLIPSAYRRLTRPIWRCCGLSQG